MTRQILLRQLARAREVGDHAAVTMLLARIKAEERRNTASALSARPGEPWSELELRWLSGDR